MAYFKAFCMSSIMSFVDSSPPPLRYQRSGVSWIILPFLAAGVSAIRAFSRTPSLLELSPPMARVRLMTKRMSGLISLTLSKLTSCPWRESSKCCISWFEFQGLVQERETRFGTKGCHFSFIKEDRKGLFVRAFIFSSDFLDALV